MTIDERIEALTMNLELLTEHTADGEERHEREMADIRAELRRGVRLSIQEARAERGRRQKLEETFERKITQLAAAQLITEEKLQRFLDSHGNGKQTQ